MCGSAFGDATKIISDAQKVDNIKWVIKFDHVFFDLGSGNLSLNYGGINISVALSERTIPFKVYNGFDDLTLVVQYQNDVLTAKTNGENLRVPNSSSLSVMTNEDLSSVVRASVSAGSADCGGGAEIRIKSIVATATVES